MWDLPGPGVEPASPALAGGFLTTEPPGKSLTPLLLWVFGVLLALGLTTHPLFHPQLQQTEAELRKVDEAISLFQKML